MRTPMIAIEARAEAIAMTTTIADDAAVTTMMIGPGNVGTRTTTMIIDGAVATKTIMIARDARRMIGVPSKDR